MRGGGQEMKRTGMKKRKGRSEYGEERWRTEVEKWRVGKVGYSFITKK